MMRSRSSGGSWSGPGGSSRTGSTSIRRASSRGWKLVLTLVEFLRQVLERQAIRRMDGGTLTDDEVERVGLALMRLEAKVREMAELFGLDPDDLNLGLGPIGKLL